MQGIFILFFMMIVLQVFLFFGSMHNETEVYKSLYDMKASNLLMQRDLNVLMMDKVLGETENYSFNSPGGLYYSSKQAFITFCFDRSPYSCIQTSLHETGHHLWYYSLTKEQRDRYDNIFNETDEWVTDYASTETTEDFAETYEEGFQLVWNISLIPEDRQDFFREISSELGYRVVE